MNAKQAKSWVDKYTTSLKDIPKHEKSSVSVTGSGHWSISQFTKSLNPDPGGVRPTPSGHAAGWRVPGYGGGDRWPVLVEGGETIVPEHLTPAVAPLMKAHGVPGFASGGVVGSYAGSPPGAGKWALGEYASTVRAIEQATAEATLAGMKKAAAKAQAAAGGGGYGTPGPGGGAPAANAALARRMTRRGVSGAEWAAWNTLEMHEAGWNQYARNASSGAYGIPQALPASKMGAAANPPQSNPHAQMSWMIGYIKCMPLDSQVLTRDGWKSHAEVAPGDETIGFNPATQRSEWTPITAVHHYDDAPLVRLSSKSWSAVCTPNHRWMTRHIYQDDRQSHRPGTSSVRG